MLLIKFINILIVVWPKEVSQTQVILNFLNLIFYRDNLKSKQTKMICLFALVIILIQYDLSHSTPNCSLAINEVNSANNINVGTYEYFKLK